MLIEQCGIDGSIHHTVKNNGLLATIPCSTEIQIINYDVIFLSHYSEIYMKNFFTIFHLEDIIEPHVALLLVAVSLSSLCQGDGNGISAINVVPSLSTGASGRLVLMAADSGRLYSNHEDLDVNHQAREIIQYQQQQQPLDSGAIPTQEQQPSNFAATSLNIEPDLVKPSLVPSTTCDPENKESPPSTKQPNSVLHPIAGQQQLTTVAVPGDQLNSTNTSLQQQELQNHVDDQLQQLQFQSSSPLLLIGGRKESSYVGPGSTNLEETPEYYAEPTPKGKSVQDN